MVDKSKVTLRSAEYFLRFLIVITVVVSLFDSNWATSFFSVIILLLSFLPEFMKNRYGLHIPIKLEFLIVFFIIGTVFLGSMKNYYDKIWWWDDMLHTLSGIILMMITFLFLFTLNVSRSVKFYVNKWFLLFLAFSITMMFGALWEIFEFTLDTFAGTDMQPSLFDTMMDLIVEVVGALVVSIVALIYISKKKLYIFDDTIEDFIRENKEDFGKIVNSNNGNSGEGSMKNEGVKNEGVEDGVGDGVKG